jgi:hypothetical protein
MLAEDAVLEALDDPAVLEFAASQNRVLITRNTSLRGNGRAADRPMELIVRCHIPFGEPVCHTAVSGSK